jgi:hypothetical protein
MPEIPDQPDNRKRSKAEQQPGFCWAVVFSNYEPAEIDMLFATKALAEERADQLGGDWQAERWAIQGWNVDQDREAAYRAGREDAARDVGVVAEAAGWGEVWAQCVSIARDVSDAPTQAAEVDQPRTLLPGEDNPEAQR